MIKERYPSFNSKVLLFGEYSLIVGSMALSIPFEKYKGQLLFDHTSNNTKSNHYSVAYLMEYFNFLEESGLGNQINLTRFKQDIERGLIFKTNIPISYGLGSSGAIVASIYNAYSFNSSDDLMELKSIFSEMESHYHGKSSGLDPLVSYLNKAILIDENGELNTVELPNENQNTNSGIFLLDTKTVGETQPLVNWFLKEYENNDYKNKIQNQLIPLNNNSISYFLSQDYNSLLNNVKLISEFTFKIFKPMIPQSIEEKWKNGLETDDYYLKLCGSGGGGMVLGFTSKLSETLHKLADFEIHILNK